MVYLPSHVPETGWTRVQFDLSRLGNLRCRRWFSGGWQPALESSGDNLLMPPTTKPAARRRPRSGSTRPH